MYIYKPLIIPIALSTYSLINVNITRNGQLRITCMLSKPHY